MTPSLSIHPWEIFLLSLAVSLFACAPSRYIEKQSHFGPDLGISASDDHLKVSLNHVIIPNGPGSWVKEARWDEYIVTIENISEYPLTIQNVRLIDFRGVYINQGMDPTVLEKTSEQLTAEYTRGGLALAVYSAPRIAIWTGSFSALTAMVPFVSYASPVLGLTEMASKSAQAKDLKNIQAEFARRRIHYVTLSGGGKGTGSGFFPLVPNPRALAIDYMVQAKPFPQMGILEVTLEKLAGLHIEQPKEETGDAEGEEEVEEEEEEQ